MKLADILKTESEIKKDGNFIMNNMIKGNDISVVGHFGNPVCLNIFCENVCLFHDWNNTSNLGYLIRALIELFDLEKEDGFSFSDFKNIPCRIILEGQQGLGSKCIGFGHFMKDKFVYTMDFAKIDEYKWDRSTIHCENVNDSGEG